MNGKRYLIKNIGILTLSQFGSKILSFLLVPLYTNILTTEEYGIYDSFHTTICLLIPILTLGISDAVLRFPLDKENDRKGIFSVAIKKYVISFVVLCIPLLINFRFNFIPVVNEYVIYFLAMYIVQTISGICINFSRGLDCIKEVGISGILCSIVMLVLNISFLKVIKLGLIGYFLANIIALLIQTLYLIISLKLWKFVTWSKQYNDLEKQMITYSVPLIANTVAWWVNSSSDRYVVIFLCGVTANGIYSVAYKIPSMMSLFQTIFNQAWTLSTVKDFDKDDSKGFFSEVYALYNFGMVMGCSVLISGTKMIAEIMYAKDFYAAWNYSPWLIISVLFGALSGYLGGIFAAVKDTKIFAKTTVVSAIVNTVLNIILVYFFGPIGAAIATLISYWLTFVIRIKYVQRYIKFKIRYLRDNISYIILILQSILLYGFIEKTIVLYMLEFICICVLMFIYKKEIIICIDKFKRGLKHG
ncbi:MAG: oligosaccharide flippase family protein [Lachnospiraceae bacterium]|nr:oligosaccharide flippase family protein [Lachnospiraceae bacterium]